MSARGYLPEIISKLSHGLIAASEYFPTSLLSPTAVTFETIKHWNYFKNHGIGVYRKPWLVMLRICLLVSWL